MKEYERVRQSLYSRAEGEAQVKSLVVHGREKIKQTLTEILVKTWLYFVISIVTNVHCVS